MNEKTRSLWPSALVVFIFSALTLAQFWPALTGAISLSKVQQLAEWDSLFAAQKSGQLMLMDPSLVYLMVPYYLLKASLIHSGQLPLWNQYSGLGCPLAADPQALAFSPLHLPLILNPGLAAYNQVLVLEIIVLGLSTFALARSLKLGLCASIFAMVAVAFCPYERWYLELLGNGFCFVPLVFWLILRLRATVTAGKVWLTSFGCAMMVLSAHPELSFFSIALACLSLLFYVLFDRTALRSAIDQADNEIYKRRLWQACLGLTAAGVLAFMLAGPMLLPFLEFLRNSDSYKFGSGAPAVVRWQTLVFNLLQPGYGGASPTLGPCTLLLIPLAFSAPKDNKTLVGIFAGLIVFGLALTGKWFPLNLLLSHPPFTYLVVNYAFPSVILMTVLLAAFGLQTALTSTAANEEAIEPRIKIGLRPLCISLILALLVVAFPLAARALHWPLISANFDMCLPDYAFNRNDMVRYSVCALLAGAAVLAIKLKPVRKTAMFLIAAICLGQGAEVMTAAKSMPKRASFKYHEESVVPELKAKTSGGNERFTATGSHLFRPNSNVVFGLSDLRTHNPLFPKRYLAYIRACGAHLDEFNQVFESPLSPLLALASTRAVLSQNPVISEAELSSYLARRHKALTVEPEPGIKASFTPAIVDKQKHAIFGSLTLAASTQRAAELSYNLALYDVSGQVLWFSDARALAEALNASTFVAIPTPAAEPGKGLSLGVQIYDNKAGHWLSPAANKRSIANLKDAFILGRIECGYDETSIASRDYMLVFEDASHLRIYENVRALPRAYAVHQSISVPNDKAALAAIQERSFDPRKTVVLNSPEESVKVPITNKASGSGLTDSINIAALTANQVIISADMGEPGIVVLNDIYYPGWQCEIDGRPAAIRRANYLMRAVVVPIGKHVVVFSYRPLSFTLGLALCIGVLLIGLAITIRHFAKTPWPRTSGSRHAP